MRFEFIAYRYGNHIVASAVKINHSFILSTQTNARESVPWEIYMTDLHILNRGGQTFTNTNSKELYITFVIRSYFLIAIINKM